MLKCKLSVLLGVLSEQGDKEDWFLKQWLQIPLLKASEKLSEMREVSGSKLCQYVQKVVRRPQYTNLYIFSLNIRTTRLFIRSVLKFENAVPVSILHIHVSTTCRYRPAVDL